MAYRGGWAALACRYAGGFFCWFFNWFIKRRPYTVKTAAARHIINEQVKPLWAARDIGFALNCSRLRLDGAFADARGCGVSGKFRLLTAKRPTSRCAAGQLCQPSESQCVAKNVLLSTGFTPLKARHNSANPGLSWIASKLNQIGCNPP